MCFGNISKQCSSNMFACIKQKKMLFNFSENIAQRILLMNASSMINTPAIFRDVAKHLIAWWGNLKCLTIDVWSLGQDLTLFHFSSSDNSNIISGCLPRNQLSINIDKSTYYQPESLYSRDTHVHCCANDTYSSSANKLPASWNGLARRSHQQ